MPPARSVDLRSPSARAALLRAVESEACVRSLSRFYRDSWQAIKPDKPYRHNWHVDYLCEYLEAVTAGELTRLCINMPPRYYKSAIVSIAWPCWEWLARPHVEWMSITYGNQLAEKLNRDRRDLIGSPWYRDHFGERFRILPGQDKVLEFYNDHKGKMISRASEGATMGFGCDRLIWDDPLDIRKSMSETERDRVRELFNASVSRLDDKKRGTIVAVFQRLHVDDLFPRLKELGYEVASLPGRTKTHQVVTFPKSGKVRNRPVGDCLWPEYQDGDDHDRMRIELTESVYAAQYDQDPMPPGGKLIDAKRIALSPVAPVAILRAVRYWDKAASIKKGSDRSAGVLVGIDATGRFWILDVVRGRWRPEEREPVIKQTATLDRMRVYHTTIYVEKEGGSAGIDSVQTTLTKTLAGFDAWPDDPSQVGAKDIRARPFAAQVGAGNVSALIAPWNAEYLDELTNFPDAAHDDMVDATSGAFNRLNLAPPPGKYGSARPVPTGPNTIRPVGRQIR